jgi:hypothetical protein
MVHTDYLRRRAEFCIRLSHLCTDPPAAENLNVMAAEFHARALRAEFDLALTPEEQFLSDTR